jgi:hypothetical protein
MVPDLCTQGTAFDPRGVDQIYLEKKQGRVKVRWDVFEKPRCVTSEGSRMRSGIETPARGRGFF